MEEILIGQQKCRANASSEIVQISSKFLRMIGYSLGELQAYFAGSYYPLIIPEDRDRVRQTLDSLTLEDPEYAVDYRVRARDGQILWIHEQGRLVREDGSDYFYCEMSDATRYYNQTNFYKNVLACLPNPVFVLNMDLRITFVNRAAEKLLGAPEKEWLGKPCTSMGTALCGTENCCVKRFLRGESAAIQQTPEGGYNRVTISQFYGENGEPQGYISVSTDVTALIQAQQDLKLSEERYRIAINQTQDAIWELDIASGTVYYPGNSTHYVLPHVITGVPQSLMVRGFIHPDSAQSVLEMYRRILAGEQDLTMTVRTYGKDGETRWIRLASTTLFDDEGGPVRAIGTSRDITDEKDLEARFLQERQYRDSLVSDAMYAYEVNLTQDLMVHLDDHWIEMFGLNRTKSYSQFLESMAQSAVHPEDRQYMAAVHSRQSLLDTFSSGKREIHCEYRRKNENGRMIWVRSSVYMIRSPEEDVCCFIYLNDIDEEKRAEIELRHKAERDSLTGLYNRDAVLTLSESALLDEHRGLCAVIMLDVDNFKQVNDTFGHLYGDAVLSETAEKLVTVFRKDDIIGRIGGDEFIVFLKGLPSADTAQQKCRQLLEKLKSIYSSGEQVCDVSVSIGLAIAEEHDTFAGLYQKADTALYHAKNHGKNRLAVYEKEMSTLFLSNTPTQVERHLAKSFSQNTVEYVFKILFNASDLERSIVSVLELLCKHFHCHHGYIFEQDGHSDTFSTTFEWCGQGINPRRDSMRGMTPQDIGGSSDYCERDGVLWVEDFSSAAPHFAAIGRWPDVKALLRCAIVIGGKLCGFIGVDDMTAPHSFSEGDIEVFQSACEIIGTFLAGKRSEQKRERYVHSLQTVLDHLDHPAYVVNPQNHELIYLNRKTGQYFPPAQVGELCHATLQDSPVPCEFCPMEHLAPLGDESRSTVIRSHSTGSLLEVSVSQVDWPDGGQYCMINSIDITKLNAAKDTFHS